MRLDETLHYVLEKVVGKKVLLCGDFYGLVQLCTKPTHVDNGEKLSNLLDLVLTNIPQPPPTLGKCYTTFKYLRSSPHCCEYSFHTN